MVGGDLGSVGYIFIAEEVTQTPTRIPINGSLHVPTRDKNCGLWKVTQVVG
jgi:hypothetical protein